jgi:hypothetical protein
MSKSWAVTRRCRNQNFKRRIESGSSNTSNINLNSGANRHILNELNPIKDFQSTNGLVMGIKGPIPALGFV